MPTTSVRTAIETLAQVWERAGNGLLSAQEFGEELTCAAEALLHTSKGIDSRIVLRMLSEHNLDADLHPRDIDTWVYLHLLR